LIRRKRVSDTKK